MTIAEIIRKVDELEPNQYEDSQKLHWLSTLDGQIFEEVIKAHEDPVRESFTAYTEATDKLLVPFPYGEDLYCWYLQAMIAAENAESTKYGQMMAMFNGAFSQFESWYNRTHRPKKAATRFWF